MVVSGGIRGIGVGGVSVGVDGGKIQKDETKLKEWGECTVASHLCSHHRTTQLSHSLKQMAQC